MDLAALRLFRHLARTLHFGRTSRECHVSPSALSRTIQRLEEELDVVLFERTHRRVRLTPAGRELERYAIEALQRFDALRVELGGRESELRGVLRVFTTVTGCYTVLPDLLGQFRRAHPGVRIELETGYPVDALNQVQRGRIDVAVASVPDRLPRAVVGKTVTRTPLLFVFPSTPCEVSERIASADAIRWPELPIILPHAGATRAHVDRWFRRRGVQPQVYSDVPGSEAIMTLVALGCGIGVVPKLVLDKSPLRAVVQVLDLTPELPDLRVAVCAERKRIANPVVRRFWEGVESAVA